MSVGASRFWRDQNVPAPPSSKASARGESPRPLSLRPRFHACCINYFLQILGKIADGDLLGTSAERDFGVHDTQLPSGVGQRRC